MAKPVILAVDDGPLVLRAVERDLRRWYARDYRVLRADSGESALDTLGKLKLRGDPVALFLVDQRMPRMTGVEFREEAIERFPDAKRALLTAYSDTEAAIRAINEVEARGRVFEPFFTMKEVGAGTGRVVAGHGGEVSVDSRPGETRFTVRLPKNKRENGG